MQIHFIDYRNTPFYSALLYCAPQRIFLGIEGKALHWQKDDGLLHGAARFIAVVERTPHYL